MAVSISKTAQCAFSPDLREQSINNLPDIQILNHVPDIQQNPEQNMYHGFPQRNDSRRHQDKQDSSKVLLVCVYDTIAFEVTNQLIYQTFSKYGPIVKVLIFQKGEVTKLFIQYTEMRFAQQAKSNLDGTKLLGAICKMNIHFSNFNNVDLRNQTTRGTDYSMQEETKNEYIGRFDQIGLQEESEEQYLLEDNELVENNFTSFETRAKTDNPRRLQQQISKSYVTAHDHRPRHPPIQPMVDQQEEQMDELISRDMHTILENVQHAKQFKFANKSNPSNQSTAERINPSLRIKETEAAKSSILKFELTKNLSFKNIYNLFSNFGNISFITKKSKTAYVKFRNVEFAAIARTYLNERSLMGNFLSLQYPVSIQEAYPKELEFCQSLYYDESYDRFTPQRSLTVNSPSQTLHVSSMRKETCKQQVLYDIFSDFGKVEAVKILCYSQEKNMALVKFYSIEESFQAIANLHNEVFSGRKMQISFTKSRI